jgi:hypothetical protein
MSGVRHHKYVRQSIVMMMMTTTTMMNLFMVGNVIFLLLALV